MEVTLFYKTDWSPCFVHFSTDGGKTWTDVPGLEMEVSTVSSRWRSIQMKIDAAMEFVFDNGGTEWDNPIDGKHYRIDEAGVFTVCEKRLTKVTFKGVDPVCVVSDLDGTMIGDDRATRAFADTWQREVEVRGGQLVYNTGRSLDSFLEVRRDRSLLTPRALITAVGTAVYWFDEARDGAVPRLDEAWEQRLAESAWQRDVVQRACEAVVASGRAHFRPRDEQLRFKIVLGVRAADVEEVIAELRERLRAREAEAKFVFSGYGEWRFLDLLSPQGGKLEAMTWVRRHLGFDAAHTVACGDSGNDIAMMEGDERGIIVGNAQRELVDWYRAHQATAEGRVYCANSHCADAILEGLRQMRFVVDT